jgi:nucleoporin NDC1
LPMKTLGGWYGMGLRGAVLGVLYALLHSYQKNSVLSFPIIQRGLFFSFKMGIRQILAKSVKLALAAAPVAELFVCVCSYSKNSILILHMRQMLWLRFVFVAGAFFTTLCWELCNHLIQVIHTQRHSFAPPLGSSAAESQPSETLLMVLEESASGSLSQHLAYLDLCNVAESNVDSWRRAAFFEETGETYKRVIGACLRPLDNLSSRLAKGLEIFESDRSGDFLRQQLQVPGVDNKGFQSGIVKDVFRDFQLCTLCARTAVSLMACSRLEDRYGVAQLSGSNILVLSSLLSCLLAVEVYLGRRSSVKGIGIVGPNSIKWTVPSRGTSTEVTHWKGFPFGKGSAMHRKAYALADVLRTAIYQIVSVFGEEMVVGNSMSGKGFAIAERDWLSQKNPLYGTQEMHLQKLSMFLEYRA